AFGGFAFTFGCDGAEAVDAELAVGAVLVAVAGRVRQQRVARGGAGDEYEQGGNREGDAHGSDPTSLPAGGDRGREMSNGWANPNTATSSSRRRRDVLCDNAAH